MSRLDPHSSAAAAEPSANTASMLKALRARLARHRVTLQQLRQRLEAQQRFVAGVLARDAEMRDTVREMRAALRATPSHQIGGWRRLAVSVDRRDEQSLDPQR